MPTARKNQDINDLVHRPGYAVDFQIKRIEPREELRSRLRQQEADAASQRFKDKVISLAIVSTVAVVTVVCVVVIFLPNAQPETLKWATTLLTTVVAGGVGHMTGKGSK